MTQPLKPPGGIYWRAAVFAPFRLDMPITIGMRASQWPDMEFDLEMPITLGMERPVTMGLSMPLFIAMLPKAAAATEFGLNMSLKLSMSPFNELSLSMPISLTMDVEAVMQGHHINTAVQRSSTI